MTLAQVFGEETERLMCWPHVTRNIDDKIALLKKESKNEELAAKVDADIDYFQWATTETEYEVNYKALVDKYTKEENVVNYTTEEEDALKKFFDYVDDNWGPKTPVKNWFAGSNPFSLTQNQGIEGKNKAIKASYTFKSRVSIGKLFQIVEVMLRDWSEQDDSLIFSHRLALLDGPEGLALKTNGWKWAQANARHMKTKSVLSVDVSTRLGAHSVSEVAGLGKPSRIWVVGRQEPKGELTDLARAKLEERARPSSLHFDDKKKIKESCWVVEERDGDFFCDCPEGFKGHLCKHTIGLHMRNDTGKVVVTDQVRSLPLGQARKRGRPKKNPHCLTRSPPRPLLPLAERLDISTDRLESSTVEEEVPEIHMHFGVGGEVHVQEVPEVQDLVVTEEQEEAPVHEVQEEALVQEVQVVAKKGKVACEVCSKVLHPNSLAKHRRIHQRTPPASSSPPPAKRRCTRSDK